MLPLKLLLRRSLNSSLIYPLSLLSRGRYIKGEFVGGCDIMTTMFKEGDLQKLLKEKNVAIEE